MYTVIVAEDEEEIRRGLIRKVDWKGNGFEVVGEAENGLDALELVEKLEPDLLLTDIHMPFLSGIELARQIREVRPTVQIAFLSGYEEFSYAQQAIQYNIVSYMLKPISSEELGQELRKIKGIIDKKFENFTSDNSAQKEIEKSEFLFPLLLDGYETDTSDARKKEIIQNAIACGLIRDKESSALRFVVIVTCIASDDGADKTTRASVNAIDTILRKYVRFSSSYLKGRVVSVLSSTAAGIEKYLHILVEEIVQSVERIMKLRCSIGVSRSVDSVINVRECYLEAMAAISYSKKIESNVHFISDEERMETIDQETIQKTISHMESLLRGGKSEDLRDYIDDFAYKIENRQISPLAANFLMIQVMAAILQVVYSVAGDESAQSLQQYLPFESITMIGQVTQTYERYAGLCMAAKELISEQRKKSSEILCDKAIEIIHAQYMDKDLSLVAVSNEIAVSPNYLSTLIKKSTGSSFVELLTRKRIEKARELLLCTSIKIREIAESCGYRDQHYFSYSFKKATGISPNSCRRTND